ncbi:50S ribosomal protein L20 [Candidatus Parcubacteria bacterium]|nr:50S ribosomal protein L20 [Candidatus Parcubacteria bacterium]
MPRVKGGPKGTRKHKKVLEATKGYWGARSKHFRSAHEAYLHAGEYAFAGRRLRRRDFRRLWIQRINAALTPFEISYSKFIKALKDKKIELDRKILADLAVTDPKTFGRIVEETAPPPTQPKSK